MSFIFRFDEDLGRGFSEQSLSLPTSQSATKVISLVDFGRFLSSVRSNCELLFTRMLDRLSERGANIGRSLTDNL